MKRFGKVLSLVLAAGMVLGMLSVPAGAEDAKYERVRTPWFFNELEGDNTYTLQNTQLLLAVNPDTATESTVDEDGNRIPPLEGSFTIEGPDSDIAVQNMLPAEVNLDTPEPQIREIHPDKPQVAGRIDRSTSGIARFSQRAAASHAKNDTLKLCCKYDQEPEMKCLYVGTHCTVWGSISDKEEIRLSETQAKNIGDEFDRQFTAVTNIFGNYFCDADGDNKVAIMCYDINNEYARNVDPSSYTAGLFDMNDMIAHGKDDQGNDVPVIGDLIFVDDNYPYNGIDCIRIDTYPLMGNRGNLMSRTKKCYSTLLHEFQHMLNFSSALRHCEQGETEKLYYMDTFLDEAFSMAAEHLVYANDPTKDNAKERVDWFNSTSYVPGRSLTYWSSDLDNYANAFLFGQYIRTRWARKGGCKTDGSDFYKRVYDSCVNTIGSDGEITERYTGDTLSVIADLLCEPGYDYYSYNSLMLDFWTAVCLKEPTGIHGFNGEDWSENIRMYAPTITSGTNDKIFNSGAKLFTLDPNETYTITATPNVRLVAIGGVTGPLSADSFSWIVSPDGALYIDKTEAATGTTLTDAPWNDLPEGTRIDYVSLPTGITSIGDGLFTKYDIDSVYFSGSKPEWDHVLGNNNDSLAKAPHITFGKGFVNDYMHYAEDEISLRISTTSDQIGFFIALYDKSGRFLRYEYLQPGAQDDYVYDGEYGGWPDISIHGTDKVSVIAVDTSKDNAPQGAASVFRLS